MAKKLTELGFPALLAGQMEPYVQLRDVILPIKYRATHGEDVVNFKIYVGYNKQAEEYEILRYHASLRRIADLRIPKVTVNGVDLRELDRKMAEVNWWRDQPDQRVLKMELNESVWQLSENDHPVGIDAQDKLILKYLADTPEEQDIANVDKIRSRHEIQRTFDLSEKYHFTALQAYNLLDGRPVTIKVEDEERKLTKWVGIDTEAKDLAGMAVLKIHEDSERFDVVEAIRKSEYGLYLTESDIAAAAQSVKDGNSTAIHPVIEGIEHVLYLKAEPWNDRVQQDYPLMIKLGLIEKEDMEYRATVAPQNVENEQDIRAVVEGLEKLGLNGSNIKEIRSAVFYRQENFSVEQSRQFAAGTVDYKVNLARLPNEEGYTIEGFHARIKGNVLLPEANQDGVSIIEWERRFQGVPWGTTDFMDPKKRRLRLLDTVDGPVQQRVDQLLQDLEQYKHVLVGGFTLQELLLYKYFRDTPQQQFIPNAAVVRGFFERECYFHAHSYMVVNAEEAYELLQGKILYRSDLAKYHLDSMTNFLAIMPGKTGNNLYWLNGTTVRGIQDELREMNIPAFHSEVVLLHLTGYLLTTGQSAIKGPGLLEPTHAVVLAPYDHKVVLQYHKLMPEQPWHVLYDFNKDLFCDLEKIGFEGFEQTVIMNYQNGYHQFQLEKLGVVGDDKVKFVAAVGLSSLSSSYELQAVSVFLLKNIQVPDIKVGEIVTGDLGYRMSMEQWEKADYFQRGSYVYDVVPPGYFSPPISTFELLEELKELFNSRDLRGRWAAEALSTKCLWNTPNEAFLMGRDPIAADYVLRFRFEGQLLNELNLDMMYNLVDGRSVYGPGDETTQDFWSKINFAGLAENMPPRLEKIPITEGWDAWDTLTNLSALPLERISPEEATELLQDGNRVLLTLPFGGRSYSFSVYAAPEHNQLVYSGYDQTSDFGKYLAGLPGWVYEKEPYREIGQHRDFRVHPVPVNKDILNAVLYQCETYGFTHFYGDQARLALQVGYPEFRIDHHESVDKVKIEASILFNVDPHTKNWPSLQSYDLTYQREGEDTIKVTFGTNMAPLIPFEAAINIAQGRYVHVATKEPWDIWYSLDRRHVSADGFYELKEQIYPVKKVTEQIDKMPIKGLDQEAVRKDIIQSVLRGVMLSVVFQSGNRETPGYLFFDFNAQKIRFTVHTNFPDLSAGIKSSQGKNSGEDPGHVQGRR